jgi:hypothetical protein
VPTPFGDTHVNASGPEGAPPLVLLHAIGTSATGWLLNIGPLSRPYRVYAMDILGEPGKTRQSRLLRDRADGASWVPARTCGRRSSQAPPHVHLDQLGPLERRVGGSSRRSRRMSACSASRWELTNTPRTAMDVTPATSPASNIAFAMQHRRQSNHQAGGGQDAGVGPGSAARSHPAQPL